MLKKLVFGNIKGGGGGGVRLKVASFDMRKTWHVPS